MDQAFIIDFANAILITTDERYTRCGGTIWLDEYNVYRPVQQQRNGNYGDSIGIAIHPINDLKSFNFTLLENIKRNFNLKNLHTISVPNGLIDYKK